MATLLNTNDELFSGDT